MEKRINLPFKATDIRINSARVSLGLISCLAATRYATRVFFLPRYPFAPVWHMGPAAWETGTGIAGWGVPVLSVPYPNNIDTDVFLLAFTRRVKFSPMLVQ